MKNYFQSFPNRPAFVKNKSSKGERNDENSFSIISEPHGFRENNCPASFCDV